MSEVFGTLIDWAEFEQARAALGADFIRIIGYFREDGEKSILRIEQAVERRDTAGFILPAHTIKGEARQLGAVRLGDLAEEIEHDGRRALESRNFPEEVQSKCAALRPLYNEVIVQFERAINPLVSRSSPDSGGLAA
jgi:HPt (histidine-containing phosphotransfer) domain-containing protein